MICTCRNIAVGLWSTSHQMRYRTFPTLGRADAHKLCAGSMPHMQEKKKLGPPPTAGQMHGRPLRQEKKKKKKKKKKTPQIMHAYYLHTTTPRGFSPRDGLVPLV